MLKGKYLYYATEKVSMAVTMVTLLPWQPLESILNNLKSSSQTNKENLSKVLLAGRGVLRDGFLVLLVLPLTPPPQSSLAHFLYTLSQELSMCPALLRACLVLFLVRCGDTAQSSMKG